MLDRTQEDFRRFGVGEINSVYVGESFAEAYNLTA
jgi:hypothetical protein